MRRKVTFMVIMILFVLLMALVVKVFSFDVTDLAGPWTVLYRNTFFDFTATPEKTCEKTFFGERCCIPFSSKQVGDLRLCTVNGGRDVKVMAGARVLTTCRPTAPVKVTVSGKPGLIEATTGPALLLCTDDILIARPAD